MKLSEIITRAIDLFYIKPLQKVIPRQTFRYAACMGFNYLLLAPLIYRTVYHYVVDDCWLDMGFTVMSPHIQALFIQFPVTFFTGFWLNRYVTFTRSQLRGRTQLFRYFISVAGSFLLSYLALKLLTEAAHIYPTIAQPLTTVIVTAYSYIMAKSFTFKTGTK